MAGGLISKSKSNLIYIKENPRSIIEFDRVLSKKEAKEKFGTGKIILKHNYFKRRFKRDKKRTKGYYYEFYPKSKIIRIYWLAD